MKTPARRREPTQFQRAADGSMTLIEHIRELRTRLFRGSIAVIIGFGVGMYFSQTLFHWIEIPYCNLHLSTPCGFLQLGVTDGFVLRMKLALWAGLVVSAPVWLYQLWAFIAPGLHRHERKWAYLFGATAGPLFILGAALATFLVSKSLHFIIEAGVVKPSALEVTSYTSFVTNLVLLFGLSFEFPVLLLLLNFTGLVSGKKMAGWWRIAIFVLAAFSAITTPDPGPFGMMALTAALSLLYFVAVVIALLNDKRRARKLSKEYGDLDDDETSQLEYDIEPIEAGASIDAPSSVDTPTPVAAPTPIERRYDDMT